MTPNRELRPEAPSQGDSHTTRLLQAAGQGDSAAASELLPLVYEELRRLAGRYMRGERSGHTLQPTALVHEAYLELIHQDEASWRDRAHFLGIAAHAMRRVLIHHARRARTRKRGGGKVRVTLSGLAGSRAEEELDLVVLGDALEQLEELDARKARVVELRFFGGFSNAEIAEALGVSLRTVEGDWSLARAWLRAALSDEGRPANSGE